MCFRDPSRAALAYCTEGRLHGSGVDGFPLRAVVSGWSAVASVKWLGRIYVAEETQYSPWNTDKYVLTGGELGAERKIVEERGQKSALE